MRIWPFIVIVLLAPLAVGGVVQLATGATSPVLFLAVLAWLGISGAVKSIVGDRPPRSGKHVSKRQCC